MSESLSRRNFLKTSAAGIVVAGAGGLILPKVAQAMEGMSTSQHVQMGPVALDICPKPPAPERQSDGGIWYIVCASDEPEVQRQYSALIHVTYPNGTTGERIEDPVMEGVDFYPFDGSYHEEYYNDVSETDFYVCRTVCKTASGSMAQSTAEFGGGLEQENLRLQSVTDRKTPPPKPPAVRVKEKKLHQSVILEIEPFIKKPENAKVRLARLWQVEADKDGNPKRPQYNELPDKPDPKVRYYKRQNRKVWEHKVGKIKAKKNETADLKDVFGRYKVPIENLGGNTHYYFITEVIYDYGEEMGALQYRGSSSRLLVDMSSTKLERAAEDRAA